MKLERCPNCKRWDFYDILARVALPKGATIKRTCKCGTKWSSPRGVELPNDADKAERTIDALTKALEANHTWHKEYDDLEGYPGSEIEAINVAAIAMGKEYL